MLAGLANRLRVTLTYNNVAKLQQRHAIVAALLLRCFPFGQIRV